MPFSKSITAAFLLLGVLFCVHESQQRPRSPSLVCGPDGLCRVIPGQHVYYDDTVRFPGPSVLLPPSYHPEFDLNHPKKELTFDEVIRFPGPNVFAPIPSHPRNMPILRWHSLGQDIVEEDKAGDEVEAMLQIPDVRYNNIKECPPGKKAGHGGICREIEE